MDIRPVYNNILVELVFKEQINGILLPENSKEPPQFIVRAVGPGRLLDNGTVVPIPVERGQEVTLDCGISPFTDDADGRKYCLLDASHITGIVIERPKLGQRSDIIKPDATPLPKNLRSLPRKN
jgi:chaperonin GroES